MKIYTGRQIRCGIGTDNQEWIAKDKVIEEKKKGYELLCNYIFDDGHNESESYLLKLQKWFLKEVNNDIRKEK